MNSEIRTRESQGRQVLQVEGRFDLRTLRLVKDACGNQLAARELCLDLGAVEALDMSAVTWMVQTDQKLRQEGGRLQIVAASAAVRQTLEYLRPANGLLS